MEMEMEARFKQTVNAGALMRTVLASQFGTVAKDLAAVIRSKLLGPVTTGPHALTCSACLGDVGTCPDRLDCDCGAAYHRGCCIAGNACLRCGKTVDTAHTITAATWVPKFAEFAQIQGLPVAVSFHCMNCEVMLNAEDTFCTSCGYHLESLHGYLCPVCSVAVYEEDGFCRCCGAVFDELVGTLIRCDSCGNLEQAGMLSCGCSMPLAPSCPECGSDVDGSMHCDVCRIHLDTA